nr:ac53 [Neodiprion sertifer nucleopolyhedrovirus]
MKERRIYNNRQNSWRRLRDTDHARHLHDLFSKSCYRQFRECRICFETVSSGKVPLVIGNTVVFTSFLCHDCIDAGTKNNPDFMNIDVFRTRVVQWLDYPFNLKQCELLLKLNPKFCDNDNCIISMRKCKIDMDKKFVFDNFEQRVKRLHFKQQQM